MNNKIRPLRVKPRPVSRYTCLSAGTRDGRGFISRSRTVLSGILKYASKFFVPGIVLVCSTLLFSCAPEGDGRIAGGSGAGNPKGRTAFTCKAVGDPAPLLKRVTVKDMASPAAVATDTGLTMLDSSGTAFIVTEASLNVINIQFKLPETADNFYLFKPPVTIAGQFITVNGPFVVDLLTGTMDPALGEFFIPVGEYDQVKAKLVDTNAPGTEMDGYTMLIKGTFDYQGIPDRRYTIKIKFNQTEVFKSTASILVVENELNDLLVLLDVRQWLAGISLTRLLEDNCLELQPDGSLVIDKTTENRCPGLENTIRKNITDSGILTKKN